jgi:hypothetical protein
MHRAAGGRGFINCDVDGALPTHAGLPAAEPAAVINELELRILQLVVSTFDVEAGHALFDFSDPSGHVGRSLRGDLRRERADAHGPR